MVKNLPAMQETLLWSLSQEDPLEKGMATHSSILAWRIPWTEEPGGLQSMGSQRVGHDWPINTHIHTHTHSFITLLDSPPEKWFIFFFWKRQLCFCLAFKTWAINAWLLGMLHLCACVQVDAGRNETRWRKRAVTQFCVRAADQSFLCSSKSHSPFFFSHSLLSLTVGLCISQALFSLHSISSQHSSTHLSFCKNGLKSLTHNLCIVVIFIRVFTFGYCCQNNLLLFWT